MRMHAVAQRGNLDALPAPLMRADQAEHPTEILTVRIPTAMRMTGIGRSKFYLLIAAKQVETVKLGSSTLVVVPSLKRFIESLRR